MFDEVKPLVESADVSIVNFEFPIVVGEGKPIPKCGPNLKGQKQSVDAIKYATLKMPSGETRLILVTCLATIGAVSNSDHANEVLGKAGRSRWLGRRPRTRPVAMNPVDHPMGGGEGRSSGGQPRSRNGVYSKGFKTRSLKKYSNRFIIEKRKK